MTVISPYTSKNGLQNLNFGISAKSIIKFASVASGIFVSLLGTSGNATPHIEPYKTVNRGTNFSLGMTKATVEKSEEVESQMNQISVTILKDPIKKSTDVKHINSILLFNSSTMESKNEVDKNNFKSINGSLEFIGRVPVKKRIEDEGLTHFSKHNTGLRESIEIKGNVEFIGKLPKKPRI